MFTSVRAGLAAALVALAVIPALAADKAFQRSDLDEAAIKLEAQIKSDAGHGRPSRRRTLRRDADAAFQKNDFRTGMLLLGQIVAVGARRRARTGCGSPRTVLQIRPRDDRERALLLDRAATAAYIAYQRAEQPQRGGRQPGAPRPHASPTASSGGRRSMRCGCRSICARSPTLRGQYERLRDEHGFRLLDYSVDADAASPRACFQFSEELPGKRTDFSPFVAVAGQDKPALSADDKQLCVEGLKHGERYTITLRAGLPSTVQGDAGEVGRLHHLSCATASRSCAFPARPMCCRAPASAAFRCVSVNTSAVEHRRSTASATAI